MFRIAKWSYLRFSLGRKKCFDEFTKNYLKLTDKTYYTFEELKMKISKLILKIEDDINKKKK